MRSFRLLDRLLGRRNEQFVPGECLGALNASMKTGQVWIVPEGAVVVPSPPEPKYPEAERIAASIRDFPEDWGWERKGYDLIHIPSGFRLWVANEDYGLAEVHPNNGKTNFTKPEQAIIWPAVADWLGHRKVGFTGRLPKVHIHFANGHWWCLGEGHPWAGAGDSPASAYRSWSRAVSIQARTYTTPNEVLHVWSAAR